MALLVTTDRVVQEARRRIELGLKRPDLLAVVDALVSQMTVVPVAALSQTLKRAESRFEMPSPAAMGRSATPTCWRWPGPWRRISGRRIAILQGQALPHGRRQT